MQPHWEARGTWEASAWRLSLCVFRDGEPLGVVGLRAQDFRALREVTTTTWLGVEHHGRGYGTEARAAILTLAFDHLNAEAALTAVFQDNPASQGVSRKLGDRHDGIQRDVLDGARWSSPTGCGSRGTPGRRLGDPPFRSWAWMRAARSVMAPEAQASAPRLPGS